MRAGYYAAGTVPERFVEVDAARLLLILERFARPTPEGTAPPTCQPARPFVAYFAPEYYLHKLDFLLRYPRYFIYELTSLIESGRIPPDQRESVHKIVHDVVNSNEPELMTQLYRRFWRGAYERLDNVEAWWHARQLVYVRFEPRGQAHPWKYYFITQEGLNEACRLTEQIADARWYATRIELIHRYFGSLTAMDVKKLQYSHPAYSQAQIDEYIPDLPDVEIEASFTRVFGEPLPAEGTK